MAAVVGVGGETVAVLDGRGVEADVVEGNADTPHAEKSSATTTKRRGLAFVLFKPITFPFCI